MGLFNWIKKQLNKIPLNSTGLSFFSNPFQSSQVEQYYEGWVFACVRAIAERVANIELNLMKRNDDGTAVKVQSHPVLNLLKDVNNFMTFYDLMERLQSNQELRGNEYWFLAFNGKIPAKIYPLQPDLVTPVGGQYEYIDHYKYSVNGADQKIPKNQIIHFKQFNPATDIFGLSTLEAARVAAETDQLSKQYNKEYFKNSARPDVLLTHPATLSKEQQERLVEQWQQNHGGPSRQFRTAVASGGLEVKAFQITQRDMEFLQQRQFSRDEILAYFRVPPTILGIVGVSNYASAKAAGYAFALYTIEPKMQRIVNTLNEFLLPLFPNSENLFFEFVTPVQEDRDLILKTYESGLKNSWLSINEVRRLEGLPDIENGDAVMGPLNLQPIGAPIAKSIQGIQTYKQLRASDKVKEIAMAAIKLLPKPEKKEPEPEPVKEPEMTDEQKIFERQGEFKVKQRDERGLEFEKMFNVRLKELWDNQILEAKNNLTAWMAQKGKKQRVPVLIDKEKEVAATLDLFTPLFRNITEVEGVAAAEFIGIQEFDVITPDVEKALLANTNKFAVGVTQQTSDAIRATITAGLAAGEGLAELEKRIEASTAFNNARAERIARSETVRAQTQAEISVWEQTGVVEGKVWYTALDERVCPYCDSMHGKTISLMTSFFKKGESLSVEDESVKDLQLDYENVDGPPLHVQCRCVIIPEISSKRYQRREFKDDEVFELYLKQTNGKQ